MPAAIDVSEPILPSDAEVEQARRTIPHLLKDGKAISDLRVAGKDQILLPAAAVSLLIRVLEQMAAGNAVTLIPVHKELTTQEAADLLGVSRPFVVAQMDAGKIPFRKVGTHRRVLVKDVLTYKRGMDAARSTTLDDLAAEAQRLKLGY